MHPARDRCFRVGFSVGNRCLAATFEMAGQSPLGPGLHFPRECPLVIRLSAYKLLKFTKSKLHLVPANFDTSCQTLHKHE